MSITPPPDAGRSITPPPDGGKSITPPAGGDKSLTPPAGGGKPGQGESSLRVPQPARLVVALPADALLKVDGQPTRSTSANRIFMTPPLDPGVSFTYQLSVEVVREGTTLRQTKQVFVRAGEEARAAFDFSSRTTAMK
jgi:uncharacterized protein (TIGR03000 family)